MRRLLPLLLLALGAIFLLSSCDQLLDAIYPNNTITVTALVSNGNIGATNPYSYVAVTLSGSTGGTVSAYYGLYDVLGYAYYYLPSFTKQPNGNFTLTAIYFGYSGGVYYQSAPQSYALSMPYNGSNTADITIYF